MRATKAYELDASIFYESHYYTDKIVYADNANKAKQLFLQDYDVKDADMRYSDECNYTSIRVRRNKEYDLIEFEGELITKRYAEEIEAERKEQDELKNHLNNIRNDESVTHCYIKKRGQYYEDNCCGYTDYIQFAGVYTKEFALNYGNKSTEVKIVPINTIEHNNRVQDIINRLQSKLINNERI